MSWQGEELGGWGRRLGAGAAADRELCQRQRQGSGQGHRRGSSGGGGWGDLELFKERLLAVEGEVDAAERQAERELRGLGRRFEQIAGDGGEAALGVPGGTGAGRAGGLGGLSSSTSPPQAGGGWLQGLRLE
ncbi:unnamed protein product, partial [Discosporangium mesarthrocarpum]